MKTEDDSLKYIKAKNRVERLKKFYNHLAVYFVINSVITSFKIYRNLDSWSSFANEFISIDVLSSWVVWGLVLLVHLMAVTFGQGWEERKIEAYMKEDLLNNRKN